MTDYLAGSEIFTDAQIRGAIRAMPCLANAYVHIKDGAYLALERAKLAEFIDECRHGLPPYRVDAFDCDKYAAVVRGHIFLLCGENRDFPESLFVAEICHWPIGSKAYHDALLLLDSDGQLVFLEPQTWEMAAVEKKVREAGEIWA